MQAWNKISRMPAPAIKKLQEELLGKMLTEELMVRHPYYKALFNEKGINPAEIKSIDDLNKIPFTEKADIVPREDDLLHTKKFVLEPPAEGEGKEKKKGFSLFGKKETGPDPGDYTFHTLYFSAGRTAKPVPIEYTHYDLDNLKEAGMRAFEIMEITRDDTLINAFTYAPNAHFWQTFYSTIGIGSTALQTGGGKVLGLEKILKALDSMEAPALVISPGYGRFALLTLDHFGFSAGNLEKIVLGIDFTPIAVVDRIKALMKELGAKDDQVRRIYFNSEAKSGWAECAPGFGYHTNPDHILVEIVDPVTGEVLSEGEPGEIVITHLDTRGTVLLRFKTGDIATGGMTTEPCPNCKRTVPRILGDIERKEHIYELKGKEGIVSFNGNHLRRVMFAREDVLLWYAELNRTDSEDTLKVVVKGVSGTDEEALLPALKDALVGEFNLALTVEGSSLDAVANKIGLEKNITEQNFFDNRMN
ncbi:MAG: phenylacetate--CoA ligase family protein [Dethiobacteria bacterium]